MAATAAETVGKQLRIMFQDEARFGRLPVVRSAWAPPHVRPVVKAAIERQFRYVYGAVSPVEGEVDWMMADSMNTANMATFLEQVRRAHPDDYILMVIDGASSHTTSTLAIPEHMKLLALPAYSPEPNPTEMLWDYVRERACANIYFDTLETVLTAVDTQLTKLIQSAATVASMFCWPWIIESI